MYRTYQTRLIALLPILEDASDLDTQDLIESGFSASSLNNFCKLARIAPQECELIISAEALRMRIARGQYLTADESRRLFCFAHIYALLSRSSGMLGRPTTGSLNRRKASRAKLPLRWH
jgi:hypothetical protein